MCKVIIFFVTIHYCCSSLLFIINDHRHYSSKTLFIFILHRCHCSSARTTLESRFRCHCRTLAQSLSLLVFISRSIRTQFGLIWMSSRLSPRSDLFPVMFTLALPHFDLAQIIASATSVSCYLAHLTISKAFLFLKQKNKNKI